MPELNEDAPVPFVHALGHLAPAGDLFFRIDAGRVLITLALLRNLAGLGDQKAGRSALSLLFHRERTWHQSRDRPIARQRRHYEAIGKRDRAKLVGFEKCGRLAHVVGSRKIAGKTQMGIFTLEAMM